MDLDSALAAKLAELEATDLRRSLRTPEALLNFASNDYLGLSRHPALIEAAARATQQRGTGAGASRLVTGTDRSVLELEAALAAWKEKEAALVFSSGYAAALGTIPSLLGPGDSVILDKLAHASLIDAARLSRATLRVFPHNQLGVLEKVLSQRAKAGGRCLIVTESIFSMDGDAAPLAELVELKEKYGAWLLVDEAHATGLYGQAGAGLLSELGLSARVEIVMATLSKALGSIGGVIAGSRTLIDWLTNRSRSFIYSTALPPGTIAASHAALDVVRGPEGAMRRRRLQANIEQYRWALRARQIEPAAVTGAIQPLLCGEAAAALKFSRGLRDRGFVVPAIRYPTVARGSARLRITLSAAHQAQQIDDLVAAVAELHPGTHVGRDGVRPPGADPSTGSG